MTIRIRNFVSCAGEANACLTARPGDTPNAYLIGTYDSSIDVVGYVTEGIGYMFSTEADVWIGGDPNKYTHLKAPVDGDVSVSPYYPSDTDGRYRTNAAGVPKSYGFIHMFIPKQQEDK